MAFIFDTSKGETPQSIELKRKFAQALTGKGMDYSPIASPWQGAARVAQAMLGGLEEGRLDASETANKAAATDVFARIAGGITGKPMDAAASAPQSSVSNPMGATNIPVGKEDFVASLMPLAQEASAKTGVDPRIIVAQAALESGWGKSAPGNNLFGIKSHGQPGGNVMPTTEVVNGQPMQTTASFRAYASPADSVSGYADFINKNPRYASLKTAPDLESQIAALGKSGYATDPAYADKVGSIARGLSVPQNTTPNGASAPNIDNTPPLSAAQGIQTVGANQPSPLDTAQWPSGPIGAPGDPAAIPANARPAQGMTPQPVQPQRQTGPDLQTLVQAASNPWLNDGQRAVVNMMLKQRMEADQHANDPLRQLQIQKAQADLQYGKNPESVREYQFAKEQGFSGSFQDWIASKRAGAGEYSLTPVYGKDKDGNTILIQPGKSGTAIQTKLPEGVTISSGVEKMDLGTQWGIIDKRTGQIVGYQPKDLRGAEREKGVGEAQGKAVASAPQDIQAGENALSYLDKIEKHPYLDRGTGITSLGNFIPGTGGHDFSNLVDQAKSGAFLQAIQQMRGLGSLSNAEGGAATAAVTRMSASTSKEAFLDALNDYRKIIKQGMARAQGRLNNPESTNPPLVAPQSAQPQADPLGIR